MYDISEYYLTLKKKSLFLYKGGEKWGYVEA